jgi:hypothetical protein
MSQENVDLVRYVYESGLFDRDPGEQRGAQLDPARGQHRSVRVGAGSRHGAGGRGLFGLDPRASGREKPERRKRQPLARRLVTRPPQDFNSNPVRVEDEECVVVLDVAIFLGGEVNRPPRAAPLDA